jgi:hypothetical protein
MCTNSMPSSALSISRGTTFPMQEVLLCVHHRSINVLMSVTMSKSREDELCVTACLILLASALHAFIVLINTTALVYTPLHCMHCCCTTPTACAQEDDEVKRSSHHCGAQHILSQVRRHCRRSHCVSLLQYRQGSWLQWQSAEAALLATAWPVAHHKFSL